MKRRMMLIADLERRAGRIHFSDLTGETESLRLVYQPRVQPSALVSRSPLPPSATEDTPAWLTETATETIAMALLEVLKASRGMEIERGVTLTGPQRDELRFLVNGRDLGDFGSRGQQRTAVLALKLAEVEWMEAQTGERPVLLLDEVLAELDQARRAYLLASVNRAEQSILTATDPGMYSDSFLSGTYRIEVREGKIISLNEKRADPGETQSQETETQDQAERQTRT
jgi:DNA replication and repair protein RecF